MKTKQRKSRTESTGILLDIGCGSSKMGPNWVGMDIRPTSDVNVLHDMEKIPWPFKNESVHTVRAFHILEHIKPWCFISVMDEIWRVLKPHGQLVIQVPYGISATYIQDPTHCTPLNEVTWLYFDPLPFGDTSHQAWTIYKPKPWEIKLLHWEDGNIMDVLMEKRSLREIPENLL